MPYDFVGKNSLYFLILQLPNTLKDVFGLKVNVSIGFYLAFYYYFQLFGWVGLVFKVTKEHIFDLIPDVILESIFFFNDYINFKVINLHLFQLFYFDDSPVWFVTNGGQIAAIFSILFIYEPGWIVEDLVKGDSLK